MSRHRLRSLGAKLAGATVALVLIVTATIYYTLSRHERETLLQALEEIGSDGGDGLDLASLGLDFGGQPDVNDEGKPKESTEAEEVPEVDSPLDEG